MRPSWWKRNSRLMTAEAGLTAFCARLEYYGWIEVETDKSYVQRVNFKEYAVKIIKTLLDIADGKQIEYQGYIYTIYSLVKRHHG